MLKTPETVVKQGEQSQVTLSKKPVGISPAEVQLGLCAKEKTESGNQKNVLLEFMKKSPVTLEDIANLLDCLDSIVDDKQRGFGLILLKKFCLQVSNSGALFPDELRLAVIKKTNEVLDSLPVDHQNKVLAKEFPGFPLGLLEKFKAPVEVGLSTDDRGLCLMASKIIRRNQIISYYAGFMSLSSVHPIFFPIINALYVSMANPYLLTCLSGEAMIGPSLPPTNLIASIANDGTMDVEEVCQAFVQLEKSPQNTQLVADFKKEYEKPKKSKNNAYLKRVPTRDDRLVLALFASEIIPEGSEVLWNYGVQYWINHLIYKLLARGECYSTEVLRNNAIRCHALKLEHMEQIPEGLNLSFTNAVAENLINDKAKIQKLSEGEQLLLHVSALFTCVAQTFPQQSFSVLLRYLVILFLSTGFQEYLIDEFEFAEIGEWKKALPEIDQDFPLESLQKAVIASDDYKNLDQVKIFFLAILIRNLPNSTAYPATIMCQLNHYKLVCRYGLDPRDSKLKLPYILRGP